MQKTDSKQQKQVLQLVQMLSDILIVQQFTDPQEMIH